MGYNLSPLFAGIVARFRVVQRSGLGERRKGAPTTLPFGLFPISSLIVASPRQFLRPDWRTDTVWCDILFIFRKPTLKKGIKGDKVVCWKDKASSIDTWLKGQLS